MEKKLILGLVGEIASGKDTVAQYLKDKYGSETISFSSPIRKIADILHLHQSRENMVWLATDMRTRFGKDIWSKVIAEDCKKMDAKIITLPNVRLLEDITHLEEAGKFFLINISADAEIRYKRLAGRGQNTDDQSKTWEQFQKDALLPTEITIREVAKEAQLNIDNNGSFEDLYHQIEEIMAKLNI